LERARVTAARGEAFLEAALQGLDEGQRRLGWIPSLQQYAIELELKQGDFSAALQRLDRLFQPEQRQEHWWSQRADILLTAGRNSAARQALLESLAAMNRLRPRHRLTPAVRELEAAVRSKLDELTLGREEKETP
jgi:Flp pilus assembly protein TadD